MRMQLQLIYCAKLALTSGSVFSSVRKNQQLSEMNCSMMQQPNLTCGGRQFNSVKNG